MSHQPYIDYLNTEKAEYEVHKSIEDSNIAQYQSILTSLDSQISYYTNEIASSNQKKSDLDAKITLVNEIIALL